MTSQTSPTTSTPPTGLYGVIYADPPWAYRENEPHTRVTGYGDHVGGTSEYNGPGHRPGTETIETWECADGCLAQALNKQSNGASRFFRVAGPPESEPNELADHTPFLYTPKPRPAERDAGIKADENDARGSAARRNQHPTVKSIEPMCWLCKLVTKNATENEPPGVILVLFMGSGGTSCAAVLEGMHFIGIEREPDYMRTAEQWIAHWAQTTEQENASQATEPATNQPLASRDANLAARVMETRAKSACAHSS